MLNREIGWKFVTGAVFFVLYVYACHQIVRFTDLSWAMQFGISVGIGVPFLLAVSQPLMFWDPERPYHGRWVHWVETGGYLAINYINDLIFVCLLRDIASFFNIYFGWFSVDLYSTAGAIITLLLPLALMSAGAVVVALGPYIFHIPLKHPKVPKDLHGFRIVQLSDIHIGHMVGERIVRKIVDKVNLLRPDLIVLTGDIIDGDPALYGDLSDGLRTLEAAYGKLYVTGNHEYYWGVDRAIESMLNAEVIPLFNEVIEFERGAAKLRVAGVPDASSKYFNHTQIEWEKVRPKGEEGHFDVILCHRPNMVKDTRKLGFHLQLSGHTHSGQFFPWNLLIGWFQRYPKGHFKIEEHLHLYVNQGTAFWGPPNRLGTWGEITVIDLHSPEVEPKKRNHLEEWKKKMEPLLKKVERLKDVRSEFPD